MTKLLRSLLQSKQPQSRPSTAAITLINPTNATPHSHYHSPSPPELREALHLSSHAQKQWARTSPSHRATILRRAASILSLHVEEVSRLETVDTGRPIRETEYDVREGIECLHYYSGQSLNHKDYMYHFTNAMGYAKRIPLGVTLGIGAWNYPLQGVLWKAVPALVFGNGMIFKPSEFTPSTALWMEGCLVEAGLPEGLFQVKILLFD